MNSISSWKERERERERERIFWWMKTVRKREREGERQNNAIVWSERARERERKRKKEKEEKGSTWLRERSLLNLIWQQNEEKGRRESLILAVINDPKNAFHSNETELWVFFI